MTCSQLAIEIIDSEEWLTFGFGSGHGQMVALELIKSIPEQEREFDAVDERWAIRRTARNEAILTEAFEYFEHLLEDLTSQGILFE